jgi:hypothetical protein
MMEMKKILAVGIIILFISVAVAPSISQSVVKASTDDDLVEVTTEKYQDFQGLSDNETPRYPKLLAFVVLILWLKLSRGFWLYDHSIIWEREQMSITHPLLLIRGMWFIWKATGWASFWMFLATVLGWNWGIEDFLNPNQSKNVG